MDITMMKHKIGQLKLTKMPSSIDFDLKKKEAVVTASPVKEVDSNIAPVEVITAKKEITMIQTETAVALTPVKEVVSEVDSSATPPVVAVASVSRTPQCVTPSRLPALSPGSRTKARDSHLKFPTKIPQPKVTVKEQSEDSDAIFQRKLQQLLDSSADSNAVFETDNKIINV
jgi:hypothetical protein